MTDRRGLGMTFDSAADLYQQARPEYPEQLYEAMITVAGLDAGDRLLEIGCASGKATTPLARRGFHITCVEPGPALAAMAGRNLASFPKVEVVPHMFEDIDPSRRHIAMEAWQRRRLYSEIRRRLDKRADGLLRRGWGAVLHVARRCDLPHAP